MDSIFEAVRAACSATDWSRGVELTRSGAVTVERVDEEEAVFLVSQRSGMISRTVTLYLDDDDWDCGCSRGEGACEHVAATVIAWRRSRESGEELPGREAGPGRPGPAREIDPDGSPR